MAKKPRPPSPAPRRFRWHAKLAVVLGATLVGLALAELIVRVLGLAPAIKPIAPTSAKTVYRLSSNPILGFELKPSYRDANPNLVFSYPSTNAFGQRDIERTLEKRPGVKRIILLGDSVVEGEGIREIDDTMSRQLERLYPDGAVEVLNFGVSGYCTLAEVELLQVKGLQFRPDVVIVVFVDNDFDNFNRRLYQFDRRAKRPAIVDRLFVASHLFRYVCVVRNLFDLGAESDFTGWNAKGIGDNNVVQGLERLAGLASRFGFQPLIAVWPTFKDDAIVEGPRMPGAEDGLVIEDLARLYGIPTMRFAPSFEEHRSAAGPSVNPRLRYTVDGDMMHPSVEGNRVAAQALDTMLSRLGAGAAAAPAPPADAAAALEAARNLGNGVPDESMYYNNMANVLDAEGTIDAALAYYEKALELNPANAVAHSNYAAVLIKKDRTDEAIRHLRLAVEQSPTLSSAHYNLALVLAGRGDREQARQHLRIALRLSSDFVELELKRGVGFLAEGKHQGAVAVLREVLAAKPDHAPAHHHLGTALMRMGQLGPALESFREAMKLDLGRVETLIAAAWILAAHPVPAERNVEVAKALAERACRLTEEKDAAALDVLAAACAAGGDFDRAIRTAEAAAAAATANAPLVASIRARLELYRQGRPFVLGEGEGADVPSSGGLLR